MKKITSTITTREITAIMFNNMSEELETRTITKAGEKFDGLERNYGTTHLICKVKEVSEPTTAKYVMPLDRFTSIAIESDFYHHGFINRKVGGEVAVVVACDLDTLENERVELPNGSERELKKACEEINLKYITTLEVKKVDVKYYFMSQEDFALYGEKVSD